MMAGKAQQDPKRRAPIRGTTQAIKKAAELSYTVIEDQCSECRSAVEGIRSGDYSSGQAEEHIKNSVTRAFSLIKDMALLWYDCISATIRNPLFAKASAPNIQVAIKTRSAMPVQVECKLQPTNVRFVPSVRALFAADNKLPPLTNLKFTVSPEIEPILFVNVPDDQPAGTYSGVIVDAETNKPGGTISVIIEAEASGDDPHA
jgi:hypothetical protein